MIIKAIIDRRRENREGKYPVKIRITERNKSSYISLNIYAKPDEFDENTGMFITSARDTRTRNIHSNSLIVYTIERINDILLDARKKNTALSPEKLKYEFLTEKKTEEIHYTFNKWFSKFSSEKTGKTKKIYEMTLRKIEACFGLNIEFDDITYTLLSAFEKKMKSENLRINTISVHFRNIRAVYNDAINNDIVSYEKYPFRKFRVKHEKTRKRAIKIEQLSAVFACTDTAQESFAVDVAKLIFYLRGINIKDLFYLEEYENGYVHYRRSKTGTLVSIRVEPEAQILLEKYRGKEHFLCFRENMKLHESITKKVNDMLSQIGSRLGIPVLTTYVFRHTWATIAAELDIPKETIDVGLAHEQNTVSDIYINFNQRKVDEANRKIIDAVNKTMENLT